MTGDRTLRGYRTACLSPANERSARRRCSAPGLLRSDTRLVSVLTYCDMTTSPDGEPVPVETRLAEIQDRYGPGDLVSRSIQRATPMILGAVQQVQDRVARIA